MVGGDGSESSPEVNATLDEAAAAMVERFGCGVEIRFRSGEDDGGVWLVAQPGEDGKNSWIAIRAQRRYSREEAEADEDRRTIYDNDDSWRQYLEHCDGQVHIDVYVSEEALRDRSLGHKKYPGDKGPKVFEQEVPDVATAIDLVARVSIAGDKAEIERRRKLVEAYGLTRKKLEEKANERWVKAKQGLPAQDVKELSSAMMDEYYKAEQQLIESFWSEIDGAKP